MNDICASAGSETEKSSLQNKCAELITKTNKCCEDKAKELKDKSSRKRGPDLNDGQAAPDPKRPRIAETVLNNTQDRDTAILGLIKAVNEVCNKPSHPNYNTYPPTPTDVPEREQRPRKRPRQQRRKGKRPSATERAKIKRKRHRLYYKKKLRTRTKLSNNNIVNLSDYNLSCAEKSILSKGLSFIPKPKSIDADDINNGINRLRKQMCSQYMQAT